MAERVLTETAWLALGAFATLFTLLWLLVDDRITTTAGVAAISWLLWALLGGSVYRVTQTGETVAAGAPGLDYLGYGLFAFSLLALFLHQFGVYPPSREDTRDTEAT